MANEKRLIDANSLENQFIFLRKMWCGTEILSVIDQEPTVDAVEVVRCKDCKHFVSLQGVPCCDEFMGLGFPNADGSDFCSYGERREGE